MESRQQSPFTGFLAGAAVGAIAGAIVALLLAPKSGKDLRRDIAEKSEDLIDKAKDMLSTEAKAVEHAVEGLADDVVNEGRMKAERIVTSARRQAESLLSNAEQVLRDARSRAEGGKRGGE